MLQLHQEWHIHCPVHSKTHARRRSFASTCLKYLGSWNPVTFPAGLNVGNNKCRYGCCAFLPFLHSSYHYFGHWSMQISETSCVNLTKWPAKHTGMTIHRKEKPVPFPGGQGSAIPVHSFPLRALFSSWSRLNHWAQCMSQHESFFVGTTVSRWP